MKKRPVIIILVLAVILAGAFFMHDKVSHEPNYLISRKAVSISADKAISASYDYGHLIMLADTRMPIYEFIPEESSEYSFEVTDIHSDNGDILYMNLVDRSFSDLIAANSMSEEGEPSDSITDKAFLQKGRRYYILFDAASPAAPGSLHSGSFTINVRKSEQEAGPAEITEDQTVRLSVNVREQGSVLFTPVESGYYRFDSEIVSGNASTGYSYISSITMPVTGDIPEYDGICRMEAGTEYFIMIGVEEITGNSAKVDVRCKRLDDCDLDDSGTAEIGPDTVIGFTAEQSGKILIYSESKGDPEAAVYDSKGFPMRSDDDSGEEYGGGKEDFAMMIKVTAGEEYRIMVSGRFSKCKVHVISYTDDME